MPYSLKDRKVLITAGSRGLGAAIARAFAAEGCHIAINYANNESAAQQLADELKAAHGTNAIILKADAGDMSAAATLVTTAAAALAGLDVVIGNAGHTRFGALADLDALAEADWDRCFAVNVKGQLALLRAAMPLFRANADGGAFVVTSSVAGNSLGGSSVAYAVTKAAQLHLVKMLASTQAEGGKVRINAVLPGLLDTEWGRLYSEEKRQALKDAAALKRDVDLVDCANVYVMLAKNTSITGQNVQVDSGLNIANM